MKMRGLGWLRRVSEIGDMQVEKSFLDEAGDVTVIIPLDIVPNALRQPKSKPAAKQRKQSKVHKKVEVKNTSKPPMGTEKALVVKTASLPDSPMVDHEQMIGQFIVLQQKKQLSLKRKSSYV